MKTYFVLGHEPSTGNSWTEAATKSPLYALGLMDRLRVQHPTLEYSVHDDDRPESGCIEFELREAVEMARTA